MAVAVGAGPSMMRDAAVAVGRFLIPGSGSGGVSNTDMGADASTVEGGVEMREPQVTGGVLAEMGDRLASAEATPTLGGYGPNRVGRNDQSSADECANCLKAAITGESICGWCRQGPSREDVRSVQVAG